MYFFSSLRYELWPGVRTRGRRCGWVCPADATLSAATSPYHMSPDIWFPASTHTKQANNVLFCLTLWLGFAHKTLLSWNLQIKYQLLNGLNVTILSSTPKVMFLSAPLLEDRAGLGPCDAVCYLWIAVYGRGRSNVPCRSSGVNCCLWHRHIPGWLAGDH